MNGQTAFMEPALDLAQGNTGIACRPLRPLPVRLHGHRIPETLRLVREFSSEQERRTELSQCLDELFLHPRIRSYLEPLGSESLREVLQSTQAILLDSLLGDDE